MTRRLITLALATWGAAILLLAWSASTSGRSASSLAATPLYAQSADGAAVYESTCRDCHGRDALGGFSAPGLQGFPQTDESIQEIVEIATNGTDEMPAQGDKLSGEEIQAVAEYLVSAFGAVGDPAIGGELYRLNCAGCHGAAGRGGALIYSETNAPSLAGVSNAEVVGAIRFGPGTMPPFNGTALDNPSVASVTEYVHILSDPPHPGGFLVPPPGPVTEGFVAALLGLGGALLAAAWVTRGGRG